MIYIILCVVSYILGGATMIMIEMSGKDEE